MQLIKLTYDHYVVVDDSEIKEGDWYVHKQKGVGLRVQKCIGTNLPMDSKKITHSTNIDWNDVYYIPLQEVKELIGEVDVEKKAFNYTSSSQAHRRGFIDGYNQALEDNKEKKYTEGDLRKMWKFGYNGKNLDDSIESLQPKTEWEVEMIDGKLKLK